MKTHLPARPNLEHLRSQAKTLLAQLASPDGDASGAIQTFIDHLPAAKHMKPERVREAGFRLADAQSAIARKTGFSNWPALTRHVDQLRRLEGSWEFIDLELDGTAMPAMALAHSRMLIDGDRFRMESPEAVYEGIFTIDVEQVPHHIDIEFIEGPEAGNWSYGIFELVRDKFRLCIGLTGAARPAAFATSRGSQHALETLRRMSSARPDRVEGGKPQTSRPAAVGTAANLKAFDDVPMTPMLTKLQGEWNPVELIQDGNAIPLMMLAMGRRSTIGNEMKVIFGGQTMVHVRMRIDDSQSPIAADYLNVGQFSTGQTTLGIMEWLGDEVRICMSPPGQPRPVDFSCETGSGRTLSRWKPI